MLQGIGARGLRRFGFVWTLALVVVMVILSAGHGMAASYGLVCDSTGCYTDLGMFNLAFGYGALINNVAGISTPGSSNSAFGHAALYENTDGYFNAAVGTDAMYWNISGHDNTAVGHKALQGTDVGQGAGTGSYNTAIGGHALTGITSGLHNVAVGYNAMLNATSGNNNVAIGDSALAGNTGNGNIAIGQGAGAVLGIGGSSNIFIGHNGVASPQDNNTIRIGSVQTKTFMAGIYNTAITNGIPVYIDSNGQLAANLLVPSSKKYKIEIADMAEASSRLMKLRPVTFQYKNEQNKGKLTLQYGLIAEEVAGVYPELVQYGKDGEPDSVLYHELSPMLLNEVQKQHKKIDALTQEVKNKDAEIESLKKAIMDLAGRLALVESAARTVAVK